jgi:putative endonuclease
MTRRDPRRLDRQALGRAGEDAAARFLEHRGYRILARNVRADGVELDLVARKGPTLVVVEVKTRSSKRAGAAEEAVDRRKQARLVRGARGWAHAHDSRAHRVRFDVIACEATATGFRVRHWEAAFDASSD